ncbi:MAG: dihydrofolate reductase, partial [Planctomycetota bacterium JB042]
MRLTLIAALGPGRLIGRDGGLPWRLPADLRRFKERTIGHVVVMGRRTFESIGRPLPRRRNLVLSRDPSFAPEGATVVRSLDEALDAAADAEEVFVIGGAAVYAEALPR